MRRDRELRTGVSTWNRCWSTRPDHGGTVRRLRRPSRTFSSPPTTCGPTPTWQLWRAPTRPPEERPTESSTPRDQQLPVVTYGPYTSPVSSHRHGASTSGCTNAATVTAMHPRRHRSCHPRPGAPRGRGASLDTQPDTGVASTGRLRWWPTRSSSPARSLWGRRSRPRPVARAGPQGLVESRLFHD